jgi:hypothetical protein
MIKRMNENYFIYILTCMYMNINIFKLLGRDLVQLVLDLDSDEYDETNENLSPPLEWKEMSLGA